MDSFSFDDLKKIDRKQMGKLVPLELYRAIRLIGMGQGLPLGGKGTTATIGRKIGDSLPIRSMEELFEMFKQLNMGMVSIVHKEEHKLMVAVDECFCSGLPVIEGKLVCDLEGAIMEGALSRLFNKKVAVREVKCNVNGDTHCEYEIRF